MSPQKQAVTIGFRSPGAQPPVFVAGTFSEPQWEPYELDFETYTPEDGDGAPPQYRFFKSVEAPAGEYQYKFRLGPGEWWLSHGTDNCVVTDDAGNRNNLLHVNVKSLSITDVSHSDKHIHVRALLNKEALDQPLAWEVTGVDSSSQRKISNIDAEGSHNVPTIDDQEDHKVPIEMPQTALTGSAVASTKVQGESADSTFSPKKYVGEREALESDPWKSQTEVIDVRLTVLSSENGRNNSFPVENDAVDNGEVSHAELTQIRQLLPKQQEVDFAHTLEGEVEDHSYQGYNFPEKNRHSHAPLLSHECLSCPEIAPHCHRRSSHNSEAEDCRHTSKDGEPHEPSEAEILDDPTIEMFPTESMEILKRIATLHSELPEDDSVDEDVSSTYHSPTFTGQPSPMFPYEMPIADELPTPRHSFDAGVDGTSDPRPMLRSSSSGSKPAAYQADNSYNHFEEVKALDEDKNKPSLRINPSSEGIRRRAIGADNLPTTASKSDSSDSVDKSLGFLRGFFDAIFYWFGSCLFAFFGGKHRD